MTLKEQLRFIRDKCPDVWEFVFTNGRDYDDFYREPICPFEFGFSTKSFCHTMDCQGCWDKALT